MVLAQAAAPPPSRHRQQLKNIFQFFQSELVSCGSDHVLQRQEHSVHAGGWLCYHIWEAACDCAALPSAGQRMHVKHTCVAVYTLRYLRSGMQRSGSSMGDSISQSLSGVMPSWKRFLSPHWVKMSTQSDLGTRQRSKINPLFSQ